MAKLYIQFFRLKKTALNTLRLVFTTIYNKQYFKFDYRMRHIHYYFKSKIMFISPKMFKIFTKYRSHSPGNKYMSLLHR